MYNITVVDNALTFIAEKEKSLLSGMCMFAMIVAFLRRIKHKRKHFPFYTYNLGFKNHLVKYKHPKKTSEFVIIVDQHHREKKYTFL